VLEIAILGPLEVTRDGRPLPLGGQKQRALLALLLLNAGDVVSTDRIADALWGDEPPRTATTSLQNFVAQVRKLLGPDVLLTRAPGYVLRLPAGVLDLERFETFCAEARVAEAPERARLLGEALDLWRGRPLPEFDFEDWARPDLLRLEDLRLTALEQRVEADLDLGEHARVVPELEALVAEHTRREGFVRQLMLALYRSGRQAEALEAYQNARRRLVDESGIEPGPALQELNTSILRQDDRLNPARRSGVGEHHLTDVMEVLLGGRLVPVLGSDSGELARTLADRFSYPEPELALTHVSQYVAVMRGSGPLYDELHALLGRPAEPTPVHRFFASLPTLLRERGLPHQLIVSTRFDHALEEALTEAGEEFDVVVYLAAGRNRGRFCHIAPDGTASVIEVPNAYASELSLARRTIVLKLHGQIDPSPERVWESFVVTEDDYIDYLSQSDVGNALPVGLGAKLRRSHFLFLGYRMSDWNLRVVLNRLWGDDGLTWRSWAVHPHPTALERQFWRARDVDVLELPLDEYVDSLARALGLEPAAAVV
jgi:DNA-binding SARP family transcriptional activator